MSDFSERYAQVQYIYSKVGASIKGGDPATAIDLLNGISNLLRGRDFADLGQAFGDRVLRDLACTYSDYFGRETDALPIFKRLNDFRIIRTLIRLNRVDEALREYARFRDESQHQSDTFHLISKLVYALSFQSRHAEVLSLLGTRGYAPSKLEADIAIVSLREQVGATVFGSRKAVYNTEHRQVARKITGHLGGWKNVVMRWQGRFSTPAGISALRRRLFKLLNHRPNAEPNAPHSGRIDVDKVLDVSKHQMEPWRDLGAALRHSPSGDFQRIRERVKSVHAIWHKTGDSLDERFFLYLDGIYRDLFLIESRFRDSICCGVGDHPHSGIVTRRRKPEAYSWGKYFNILNLLRTSPSATDVAEFFLHYNASVRGAPHAFCKDHKQEFILFLEDKLQDFLSRTGEDVVRYAVGNVLAGTSVKTKNEYEFSAWPLFVGLGYQCDLSELFSDAPFLNPEPPYYDFDSFDMAAGKYVFWDFVSGVLGDVENELRTLLGLPEIGQGWVSQAEMLRCLREAFAPVEVLDEASPEWLGQQRFDAYIPDLLLAVEYQGRQHFEPVEFFGGEEALQAAVARDALKLRLAEANGVRVEYIRFDEDIHTRVGEIRSQYRVPTSGT